MPSPAFPRERGSGRRVLAIRTLPRWFPRKRAGGGRPAPTWTLPPVSPRKGVRCRAALGPTRLSRTFPRERGTLRERRALRSGRPRPHAPPPDTDRPPSPRSSPPDSAHFAITPSASACRCASDGASAPAPGAAPSSETAAGASAPRAWSQAASSARRTTAHLGRQTAPNHHHPVLVHPRPQRPRLVPPPVLRLLRLAVHPPPRPHDLLHVGGGARRRHVQQVGLGLGRRHPRDRAHLRVGDLAAPHRVVQLRQVGEGRGPPARAPGPRPARARCASPATRRRRCSRPSRSARRTGGSGSAAPRWPPECGRRARRCGHRGRRPRPGDRWGTRASVRVRRSRARWRPRGAQGRWVSLRGACPIVTH